VRAYFLEKKPIKAIRREFHPSRKVVRMEGPTHFDFVVNLKTAKALGLTMPPLIPAEPRRRAGATKPGRHSD
jgi:hypothetical protein